MTDDERRRYTVYAQAAAHLRAAAVLLLEFDAGASQRYAAEAAGYYAAAAPLIGELNGDRRQTDRPDETSRE